MLGLAGLDGRLVGAPIAVQTFPVPCLRCYAVLAVLAVPADCSQSINHPVCYHSSPPSLALDHLFELLLAPLPWRPRQRLRPGRLGLAILGWGAQFLFLLLIRATDCTSAITETAGRARAVKLLEIISTLQR